MSSEDLEYSAKVIWTTLMIQFFVSFDVEMTLTGV